jgi:cell division transport system ATP-binding protein
VRLDAVSFSYGRGRVLTDVSLALRPGELAHLVGPSGAGKTTLLRLLHGQLRPSGGSLVVHGIPLHRARRRAIRRLRRAVAVVFQDYKLLGRLTALENVVYALRITDLGIAAREARRRAAAALTRLGLEERGHAYPAELSGGQQQRVAIARALVVQPSVLLADEPTAHLDHENAASVLGLLARVAAGGATVLIATCDPALEPRARRVIRLARGEVVSDPGPPAEGPCAS